MTSVDNIRNFKGIAIAKLDVSQDEKASTSMPSSPTPTIFRFTQPPHLTNFTTEDVPTSKCSKLQLPRVIQVSTSVPNVNDVRDSGQEGNDGTAKSLEDLIQDISPDCTNGMSKCEGINNMIDQGPIPLPVLATRGMNLPPTHMNTEPEGLILPKKLHNPCIDSGDRQNVHKELMFNQKIGKSVLNQKSELQRALEKHKDHQLKKEIEQQKLESKTAFEKVIEERAKRLETMEIADHADSLQEKDTPEFLQVHAKLRAKMESK